ncbi:hypothetical protein [Rhizobium aegyptiacum]|uniref:hypothetical protein n=1 Tax=Rhizobium aegyptiacum TaxID=1764550 RepID=UPI0007E5AD23|nr:hypothetical protein [Rhizobium aegyptiacum]
MKMLFSSLAAMVLSASFALPLNAMPILVPKAVAMHTADVEQVKHRKHHKWHANRHWKRQHAYRDCRYFGSCYRPRYSGYRDYYGYRDDYRRRSGVTVYFNF